MVFRMEKLVHDANKPSLVGVSDQNDPPIECVQLFRILHHIHTMKFGMNQPFRIVNLQHYKESNKSRTFSPTFSRSCCSFTGLELSEEKVIFVNKNECGTIRD